MTKIELNVKEYGKDALVLHEELATGDINGRKFRLISSMTRNPIVQLYDKNNKSWASAGIDMKELTKELCKAIIEKEQGKKIEIEVKEKAKK